MGLEIGRHLERIKFLEVFIDRYLAVQCTNQISEALNLVMPKKDRKKITDFEIKKLT